MFDRTQLMKVLALHRKTYELFLWCNQGFLGHKLRFDRVHRALSFAGAAADWLEHNRGQLPAECRPAPEDLPQFITILITNLGEKVFN